MAETCYRHRGRETNVSCSRCGRPICPDCMRPSPVGMRCPECAGEPSGARRAAPRLRAGVPYATYALLGANVLVFFAELGGGGGGAASLEGGGTLISDGGLCGPAVGDGGACGNVIVPDGGEWWRIVSSGFLHAGPIHLLFNMFVLYVLGTLLEPAIGTARMVGIYFVSLLAGSFGALLLTPDTLTVGASGAVYGIMAATLVIARDRGGGQLTQMIGLWLVLNLAFTFTVPGISIGGHLGGLAGGAIAALIVLAAERRLSGANAGLVEALGLAAIGAVTIAGALAVAAGSGAGSF